MEHSYMPVIYICAPYADDPEGNTEKAKKYARFATDSGYIPISPHLLLSFIRQALPWQKSSLLPARSPRKNTMKLIQFCFGNTSHLWAAYSQITLDTIGGSE